MSKMIIKAIIYVVFFFAAANDAFAVELIIPPDVSITLDRQLGRNYSKYTLQAAEADRIKNDFMQWVLQSIDFDVARRTEHDRFGGRTTYYQELAVNKPIFVYYKPGQQGLPNDKPVPIFYRNSSNRFSFRKLLDVAATQEVDQTYAAQIVDAFLVNNGFIKRTAADTNLSVSFAQLRQKHPPDVNNPEKDVLMFQQVRMRRKFSGAQVINSRISVDFHPDNLEILGFKHYNWTPVNEGSPIPVPRDQIKSRTQVEEGLKQRIATFWRESQTATLTNVTPMWFQTETELIPILTCDLEREETGCGDNCTSFVNISGSDDIFLALPKIPVETAFAPDCYPSSSTTFEQWINMGSPNCWCWPYQCDGDADNKTSGAPYYYRVFTGDLACIIANWKKKITDPTLNPCVDIDHKSSGAPYFYRVFTGDLARIITNWKKRDSQLPGNCPRPE